jgi:hypothetical protein
MRSQAAVSNRRASYDDTFNHLFKFSMAERFPRPEDAPTP